jgi:hypothetical protein
MSLQGSLTIERMCQLAQVSRAGFYRSLAEHLPVEEEMEVRSTIQQIALEHRRPMGIGELRPNCTDAEWPSTINVFRV